MNIPYFILIGLGGFIGSIARYVINMSLQNYTFLPMGTLIVNIIGSFIAGFIMFHDRNISPELRMFCTIGFTAALTTMSTFAYETFVLLESHNMLKATLNICANVALSLFAIYIGKIMAKAF